MNRLEAAMENFFRLGALGEKVNKLQAENDQLKAEVTQLNGILRNSGWGQGEIDSAAHAEETIAQLKAEARENYDFLIQSRDCILHEFCLLQVTYGEQKHEIRNLKAELAQAKVREARLMEALKSIERIRFLLGNDPKLNPAYEMADIAQRAIEEAGA